MNTIKASNKIQQFFLYRIYARGKSTLEINKVIYMVD